MGPEYICHYFWDHIIFQYPSWAIIFFFLHIKKQNIFLDKNPAPPPPPRPPPDNQMVSPLQINYFSVFCFETELS